MSGWAPIWLRQCIRLTLFHRLIQTSNGAPCLLRVLWSWSLMIGTVLRGEMTEAPNQVIFTGVVNTRVV